MKKTLIMVLALVMVVAMVFVGCQKQDPKPTEPVVTDPAEPTDSAEPAPEGHEAAAFKIGIVTSSGVDDGSFNQAAYEGIMTFLETHPNCSVNVVKEPDLAKIVNVAGEVLADYDVLVLPGFQFAPIGDLAADNPDKKILLVDTTPTVGGEEAELDNVYSMMFAEEESGFFAGLAAALQTKTNKVAVVNGIAFPSNVNYQYGFMCGVNYANAKYGTTVEILELASYAGTDVTGKNVGGNYCASFADEAMGKTIGSTLIGQGADILFVAAGASGNGVFTAAKEAGVNVIGCDVDQYKDGAYGDNKNIILTSALKVMDINVTRQLEEICAGTFKGQNALLKADTDSTGFVSVEGHHQLTADTIAKLNECMALLKAGTIVPASNFNGHTPTDFPGLN